MPLHSTQASITTHHCGRPILNAWDDGLLVRAEPRALTPTAADALHAAGWPLYVLTAGRHLVRLTDERLGGPPYGALHAEHRCPRGKR